MRLDLFLKQQYPSFSRTYFQWLIDEGHVLVNGERVKKRCLVGESDDVEVNFVVTRELALEAEDIPLDILYEDAHMLAVNKPAGMVVHPAAGNWSGTFVNALIFYCKTLPLHDTIRPGIVHRLDKDTTGVLLAAKTVQMHQLLTDLFAARSIEKRYLAICVGKVAQSQVIDAPIGRHPTQRKLMAVVDTGGRQAITHVHPIKSWDTLSLVDIDLKTGRTHQIRVHMEHIGHPVLGCPLYGQIGANLRYGANRQLLHCANMSFIHPITHQSLKIEAPVPEDMAKFLLS